MATAPPRGDAQLVRRLRARDRTAWEQVYAEHESRLFGYCYRLSGNPHDAADLVQETFVRALPRLDALDPETVDIRAYLFTTARNLFLKDVERVKRQRPVEEVPDQPAPLALEDAPEGAVLLAGQQEEVRQANARLNPRHRLVLALRELEEKSYAEIGELLDMNENAVAQLISRARISLRDELRLVQVDRSKLSAECQRYLPLLAQHLDGELRGDRKDAVLAHVESCDDCQRTLADMREAQRRYRAIVPPVLVGIALKDRVGDALGASGYWEGGTAAQAGGAAQGGAGAGGTAKGGALARLLGREATRRAKLATALGGAVVVAGAGVAIGLVVAGGDEPVQAVAVAGSAAEPAPAPAPASLAAPPEPPAPAPPAAPAAAPLVETEPAPPPPAETEAPPRRRATPAGRAGLPGRGRPRAGAPPAAPGACAPACSGGPAAARAGPAAARAGPAAARAGPAARTEPGALSRAAPTTRAEPEAPGSAAARTAAHAATAAAPDADGRGADGAAAACAPAAGPARAAAAAPGAAAPAEPADPAADRAARRLRRPRRLAGDDDGHRLERRRGERRALRRPRRSRRVLGRRAPAGWLGDLHVDPLGQRGHRHGLGGSRQRGARVERGQQRREHDDPLLTEARTTP
ncbi:MAG: sigma-70 family RNA polymerase sigma factor [Thermoleophilia bacterium]